MRSDSPSCAAARAALSDYLADLLMPRRARSLEEHLKSCPACQQTLAELRHTIALLGHLPRHAAPERLKRLAERPNTGREPAPEAPAPAAAPAAPAKDRAADLEPTKV